MNNFVHVNEVYSSYFKGDYPARATIQADRLPKDANVEISVEARACAGRAVRPPIPRQGRRSRGSPGARRVNCHSTRLPPRMVSRLKCGPMEFLMRPVGAPPAAWQGPKT